MAQAASADQDADVPPREVAAAWAGRDLEPNALLAATADVTARLLGVRDVWILLHDLSADVLRVGAAVPIDLAGEEITVPVGDSFVGQVVRSGQPLVIPDLARHPLWSWELPLRIRPRGGVFLPLQHRGESLGVLVGLSEWELACDERDLELLKELAVRAMVAIQNDRLQQDARHQARQLAAILDINKRLALGPQLGEILSRIAEGATHLLGAGGASLRLLDDGALVVAATFGAPDSIMVGQLRTRDENLSSRVANENRPLIFTDLAGAPGPAPDRWSNGHGLGLHSWLGVPLRGRASVLGTLAVLSRDERRFSREDVALLEAFADQAALAIENARLLQQASTVEALRELTRLKTEFLSTVSHELRTPLSLIFGYAELLVHRAPSLSAEQVADMAGEIHAGSRTMVRLVDDLLDFSRLEQDRLYLQRRRVMVTDLLGWLLETFRHQPGGERIVADLGDGLEAFVDPERLSQVVGNLLTNALRYAPNGPILVRATRRGGWLWVEVADHGPGIPPDEQDRVWEKFYRGSATATSHDRGNGLGLAVVKHLVELHGGRVSLSSVPGRSTTFSLAVPAVEPAPAEVSRPPSTRRERRRADRRPPPSGRPA